MKIAAVAACAAFPAFPALAAFAAFAARADNVASSVGQQWSDKRIMRVCPRSDRFCVCLRVCVCACKSGLECNVAWQDSLEYLF